MTSTLSQEGSSSYADLFEANLFEANSEPLQAPDVIGSRKPTATSMASYAGWSEQLLGAKDYRDAFGTTRVTGTNTRGIGKTANTSMGDSYFGSSSSSFGGTRAKSLPPLQKRLGVAQSNSIMDGPLGSVTFASTPPSAVQSARGPRSGLPKIKRMHEIDFATDIVRPIPPKYSSAMDPLTPPDSASRFGQQATPSNSVRSVRTPRGPLKGITATQHEARHAYNSIDEGLASDLDAKVKALIQQCENLPIEEATGVYVVLERCHSCSVHHRLTTRHQEDQYASLGRDLLQYIRHHAQGTILEVGEVLCRLDSKSCRLGSSYAHGLEIWHTASRVGAFEVYLLAPNLVSDAIGTVVQYPENEDSWQNEPRGGSWGAQLKLPETGYVATLLHSKLSSKNWPSAHEVTRRLFQSLPRASISVRVFCPSGLPLPLFTLEVIESESNHHKSPEDLVHLVAQGTEGNCLIEGVPLHTTLVLRVYHATMRVQTFSLIVSRLRVAFVFGADVVFRLWSFEVPGGLAIWASVDHVNPLKLAENSHPFDGYIETVSGKMVPVKERVQLPWDNFRTGQLEPADAFSTLKKIHVNGYHSAELEKHMRGTTMHQLHQQEFFEIATLAAPEVCIQIVLPSSRQPVSNVRLEVAAEQQSATTNEQGQCWIVLRVGTHKLRLYHDCLTSGWVEQEIVIETMEPRLQVPLPLRLKIWEAPTIIRGDRCCCDIWISAAGSQKQEGWLPYTGELQADGKEIQINDGMLDVFYGPPETLDDLAALRPPDADPLAAIVPAMPFSQRVDTGAGSSYRPGPSFLTLRLERGPAVIGTTLTLAPTRDSSSLLVHSKSACCGAAVYDLEISVDKGSQIGSTNEDGTWVATGLEAGEHQVEISHAKHFESSEKHMLHLPGSGGQPEFPHVFAAQAYFYMVDGSAGQRIVQVTASERSIPAGAQACNGLINTEYGEITCSPSTASGRILPVKLCTDIENLPRGASCPFSVLTLVPELKHFQWFPVKPSPLASSKCGLCQILNDGPITLGILRSFATLKHIDGREFVLLLEEYPKISDVMRFVSENLMMAGQKPLSMAVEGGFGNVLEPGDMVEVGQRLCSLICLDIRVVFGYSDVGISGALLSICDGSDDQKRLHEQVTPAGGRCTLALPAGAHTIRVSHPLLGEEPQFIPVQLETTHSSEIIRASPQIFVYATPSPTAHLVMDVWLCAHSGQLPRGAKAVGGLVRMRPTGDRNRRKSIREIEFNTDASSIEPIKIEEHDDTMRKEGDLPTAGISLECNFQDYIWRREGKQWLLEDIPAWVEFLSGAVHIGTLQPPLRLSCHIGGPSSSTSIKQMRLPADLFAQASTLRAEVATRLVVEVGELEMYLGKRRIKLDDIVPPLAQVDVWLVAPLKVWVRTRCCLSGIPNIPIRVTPNESPVAEVAHTGSTDTCGMCSMMGIVGKHTAVATCGSASTGEATETLSVQINSCKDEGGEGTCLLSPTLFVYSMGENVGDVQTSSVWICARAEQVPENARQVSGALRIHAADLIPLGSSSRDPIVLPQSINNTEPDLSCPLLGLKLEIEGGGGLHWFPEDPSPLAASARNCCHLRLLEQPICMGAVKPAIIIHCEEGKDFVLPADEHYNIESVRLDVSKRMNVKPSDIGIFDANGLQDDEFDVYAGQEYTAAPVSIVKLRVVVPEGDDGDGDLPGLKEVSVEIDGEEQGSTDADGHWSMVMRCGSKKIMLRHPCYGAQGKLLDDVVVLPRQSNEITVLADIRLYIFACKENLDDENSQANVLVWLCASFDQVTESVVRSSEDILSISGRVFGTGLDGKEVVTQLGDGATELCLVSGGKTRDGDVPTCSLASVGCEVSKLGYCWRPREPSPLKERTEDIGGCEYLRLLGVPAVIGYLDPACIVRCNDAPPVWCPVTKHDTVWKVKEFLQDELKIDYMIRAEDIVLLNGGIELEDLEPIKMNMDLEMRETSPVQLRVVTGCCCEPFDGVKVKVDGRIRGETDSYGKVGDFNLSNGPHTLTIEHVVLSKQGIAVTHVIVEKGKPNIFTIVADTRCLVYATEPDPEDQEYDQDSPDGEVYLPEPAFVWIAANPEHISPDAVPVHGHITCQTASGTERKVMLGSSSSMLPVRLEFGVGGNQESCMMRSVSIHCRRTGYAWKPKVPSPMEDRLTEIGGCEFLRVLACPVCLGQLQPAVTVQCASGFRCVLPLSEHPTFEDVTDYVARELGHSSSSDLHLVTQAGKEVTSASWTPASMTLACACPGESIAHALELLRNADIADDEEKDGLNTEALAEFEEAEKRELSVLETTTREGSWLADLGRMR